MIEEGSIRNESKSNDISESYFDNKNGIQWNWRRIERGKVWGCRERERGLASWSLAYGYGGLTSGSLVETLQFQHNW